MGGGGNLSIFDLTLQVTQRVSYKKQELFAFCEHQGSHRFWIGLSCSSFSFCLLFFPCDLCPMLPVSLAWIVHTLLILRFSRTFII
jgi:hypothetical protein